MEQLLQENQIRDLKEFNSILYGIRNPSSEIGNSGQIIKIINGVISVEYEFSEYVQLFSLCNFQSNLYVSLYPSGRIYKSAGVNTTSWTEVFNFGTYECEIKSLIVFNNEIYASLQIIENGKYQGKIYKSSNGTVWTEVYSDSTSPIFSLFVFDSKIYAGSKNKIIRSNDGSSWTKIYSTVGDIYTFGEYAGEIFAGISSPSKIIRSLTGDSGTWSDEYTPPNTDYTLTMVSSAGKLLIGTDGYIFVYDGSIWNSVALTEIAAVSSILFGSTLYFGTYNNGTLIESDGEAFIFEKKVEVAPSESLEISSSIWHLLSKLVFESLEIAEGLISKAIYKRIENEDINIEENISHKKSFTKIAEPTTEHILEEEIIIKIDITQPQSSLVKVVKSEKIFIVEGRGYRKIGFYEEWIAENEISYSILRKYGNQIGGYNYIGLMGETIYVLADSDDGIIHKREIKYLFNDGQVQISEGEVEGNARDNRLNPAKIEVKEYLMIKMPFMRSFENINISEHVRVIRESQYSKGYYDSNVGKFVVTHYTPPETVNIEDTGCVMQWYPSFTVLTGYRDQFGVLHTTLNLVKGGREGASPAMGWDALGYYHKHDWLGNEIWEYPNPNYNPNIPGSPTKYETIWNTSPWRAKGKSCWDKFGNISGEIIASHVPIKVNIYDFFGKFVLFPTIQIVQDTIKLFEGIIKKGGWYYKVINEDVEIPEERNVFREHIKKVLDEIVVNIISGAIAVKGFVRIATPETVWLLERKAIVGIPTPIEYGDDYVLIFEESFVYINELDIYGNIINRVLVKSDVLGKFESKMRKEDVWIKEMPGDIGWHVFVKIKEIASNIQISSSTIWNFFLKEILSSIVNIYSEVKANLISVLILKVLEPIILEIYSEALNKKKIKEILENAINILSEALNKKKIKEVLGDIIEIYSEGFYIIPIVRILESIVEISTNMGYIKKIRQILESSLNIEESILKFADFIRVISENIKIFSVVNLIQKTYTIIKEKGRMFVYQTKKFRLRK